MRNIIRINYFIYLVLGSIIIISCKKNNPEPPQSSPASSNCKMVNMVIKINDTTAGTLTFYYDAKGRFFKQVETDSDGSQDVVLCEYDSQGRLIKYIDGYDSISPNTGDIWKYYFDPISGVNNVEIYTNGISTDSSVFDYQSSAVVIETKYRKGVPLDTITIRYEADSLGNLWKMYSNKIKKDSMMLIYEYEYYSDDIPSEYSVLDVQPSVFKDKKLTKKEVIYDYTYSNGQWSQTMYSNQWTYVFDQDHKIIEATEDDQIDSELYKYIMNYTCQ